MKMKSYNPDSYRDHLKSRDYNSRTLEGYLHYRDVFLAWLEEENLTVENCQYADLLSYVKKLKASPGKREGETKSRSNINSHIRGIKYYYDYLSTETSVKVDNPAQKLKLKGRTTELPSDLLTIKELDKIYQEYPEQTITEKRDKIILGLVIYQGMKEDELSQLEPQHINLNKGIIKISQGSRSNRRTLKLEPHQIMPLHHYIHETLPQLKAQSQKSTDKLLVSLGRSTSIKSMMTTLGKRLKRQYPRFKNMLHVRVSVIAYWAEKKNLREVQYMAGHKTLVSTEVYRRVNLKDLKKALNLYHPLRK